MDIIFFYDPDFPFEGARPDAAALTALAEHGRMIGTEELQEALSACPQSLVWLHGAFFPEDEWPAILGYLRGGGGLTVIGGPPFARPVIITEAGWQAGPSRNAFHRKLHIHETLAVDPAPIQELVVEATIPLFKDAAELLTAGPTWNFILHASKSRDIPAENGACGPMDAFIHPLVKGVSAEGREVAAPVVLLENMKGEFAGARWIFVNLTAGERFWSDGAAGKLAEWARFCGRGVTEMWLKSRYVCYDPGDRPVLTFQIQALNRLPAAGAGSSGSWTIEAAVFRDGEEDGALWSAGYTISATPYISQLAIRPDVALDAGFYRVRCRAVADCGEERLLWQGFWAMDEALLAAGSPLTAGRDYFYKDGQPLPIVGMTYMTSDVSRKYLFLPNAYLWDRDMAQMKKAGINLIRTGFWTGWRQAMFVDGHVYEGVLRAFDAFVLTAKKYGIEVTLNFFAFAPEAWEGVNPYLDPRSLSAQKNFILAFASRHRRTTNVQWDLINEPSLFDPARIFAGPSPSGDSFEQAAFAAWLRERHGSVETLRGKWDVTEEELPSFAAVLPPEQDQMAFDVEDMRKYKNSGIWLDYTLFTMDMHNRWARELTAAIRGLCPGQLVTVGQDEAVRKGPRPMPLFYAEAVDYTTVHTWWLNDQLLWNSIFAKAPDKPCLVQETGMMYVETPDHRAKRTEAELRNMLERKYAYSFAAGGAGAVQWLWNTNYFMDNINESNIGALRADGTEKPEADVSYDFGRFMAGLGPLFEGRKLEEVAVVYPFSNDFSNRRLAFEATTKLVRVFAYDLKVPVRGIGEYHLSSLAADRPKLIVVPSAHNLDDEAMDTLLAHIGEHGGTLLVTGPVGLDAYWRPTGRLSGIVGPYREGNVLREERLDLEGQRYPLSFGARRIAEAALDVPETGGRFAVTEAEVGLGRLLWLPLPAELNERSEPLIALYRYALRKSGCEEQPLLWHNGGDLPGLYGRKLEYASGSLFVFVSEYADEAEIDVEDPASGRRYRLTLERERCAMFATDAAGSVVKVYRPEQVRVEEPAVKGLDEQKHNERK